MNMKDYDMNAPCMHNTGQQGRRAMMQWATLDEWLNELYYLVDTSPPFYWSSDFLGSPKYDNGIDAHYEEGLSPLEALVSWKEWQGDD